MSTNPTYTVELTENQLRSLKAVAYGGIEELTDMITHASDGLTDEERAANHLMLTHATAATIKVELALSPGGTLAPLPAAIVEQSDIDTTDIGAIFDKSLQERGQ